MQTTLKFKSLIATAALMLAGSFANGASKGVEVAYLGTNNTLVRVLEDGKYLLLPVQESNEDASITVLVDGKPDRIINVRLAKSKVDYMVPLPIDRYAGHKVVLNVVTTQGRGSVREAKDDACWSNLVVTDTFDTANREKYRPAYHHTPLYGWMNDPNGMFYADGKWHLYYQWNPFGSKWQNMTWGHSSSEDLVNWTHHPAAIEPNGLGTVFSGSCVVDSANTAGFGKHAVLAMYTSAAVSQIQSLAYSKDKGETFTIFDGNPTLTLESEARDPNMFFHNPTEEWVLVLAHALDKEMLIFTSPDMKTWTLQSSFGKGLGAQDGVWECPDLFELPIAGSDKSKWVLICNINPGGPFGGSATQYFIGDFDGKTFTPDRDAQGNVPTKWMDYGKDHYATVSFSGAPDGRRTVIGWMSNWQYAPEVPTMQFRSANTLPRDLSLFKGKDGSYYLASRPSPEIDALRGKIFSSLSKRNIGKKPINLPLPELSEVELNIKCNQTDSVIMTFSNPAGEKTVVTYHKKENTVSVDRRESGITSFSSDFPCVTTAPAHSAEGEVSMRIFIDRSSLEVFERDGRFLMTNLVFPSEPYNSLSVSAYGGKATISNLKIYQISNSQK